MPTILPEAVKDLQKTLDDLGKDLPGVHLAVASSDSILFSGQAGNFDMLHPGRQASPEDILWFASTTKLLTAVCYLQLVDRGDITLDTDMRGLYPPLKEATSKILEGFNEGEPVFKENNEAVTLTMMLNQTSGFGMEFGEKIPAWKKVTEKGKGFVNSCKIVSTGGDKLTTGKPYPYTPMRCARRGVRVWKLGRVSGIRTS
jgi:CubicO group peptidase (beta-lactamase class C family)